MVLEAPANGQLELGFGFMFCLLPFYRLAAGAVEMWESGVFVLAGFPSPVERVGNSLELFEFSTLSTGRHFHGA